MIRIGKVRFCNFLSFGNTMTEIDLSDAKHVCIVGKNGSGKSTILDVMCFGLFGKPFRKVKKGSLINRINNSGLYTDINLSVNGTEYRIERGMKPGILKVWKDGFEVDQESTIKAFQQWIEDSILGTDFRTFTQVVILGSANFVPFMRMLTSQRRDVIEDILGIRIFTGMNYLLKHEARLKRDSTKLLRKDLKLAEDKLDFIQEQLKSNNETRANEIQKKNDQIDAHEAKLVTINAERDELEVLDELDLPNEEKEKVDYFKTRIDSNLAHVTKDIGFFTDNDVCPTCEQNIDQEFKDYKITVLKEKSDKFEEAIEQLKEKARVLTRQIMQMKKRNQEIADGNHKINLLTVQMDHQNLLVDNLKEDIAKLEAVKTEQIDSAGTVEIEKEIKGIQTTLYSEISTLDIMQKTLIILRDDGAKTMIIDYYLPIINQLISKYLELFDFNIAFTFDKEFNEVIKSRNFDEFSYFNFSEGEKARIDIALLFTWRELAKRRNSITTNIIILDEMFDGSLDVAGIDDMKQLLDEISDDENVLVISHRDDLKDQFNTHIEVTKPSNFSQFSMN